MVVGSVTREHPSTRLALQETRLAVRPLGLDAFRALADGVGWQIDRVIDQPASHVVRLVKKLPSI